MNAFTEPLLFRQTLAGEERELVSFGTHPSRYRHWKLSFDGPVATLGMGLLIGMVFTNEARWTGGPDGMPVTRLVLLGWTARGTWTWYWISGVTLALGTLIAINLIDSPTGRAFRAN